MKVILTGITGGLLFGFAIGHAAEREKPQKMTCADVRAVVAIVGEAEAERAARAAGRFRGGYRVGQTLPL